MLLRWLLPVVAVLAFLASSVTAFAATGFIGEAECCCPDPDTCRCHDHDEGPQPASEMKRCGGPAVITQIEWAKDAGNVLADDEAYYEITIRAKIPNAPYTQLPIVVHQICLVGGVEMTLSWDVLPPGTGNTDPVLTIVPQRLNATGWNQFTIPAGVTVPDDKLGWNIHGHANGGTQIIFEEHDKSAVTYTFAPATQAEWYLLVRNEGQANMEVMVNIELFGGMQWAWL